MTFDELLKKLSESKHYYTFKVEFRLPEQWDNKKNRERFEQAIYRAFMDAFPDGVEIINRGLYFRGAVCCGTDQTLACQDGKGGWSLNDG